MTAKPEQRQPVTKQIAPENQIRQEAPSGLSSFMNENILRTYNVQERDPSKPIFLPSNVQQNASSQHPGGLKSMVGDKRLQKRENTSGNIDPFMMSTMQGDYNPTQKPKINEQQPISFDPLTGNYRSSAPGIVLSNVPLKWKGVYQQVEKQVVNPKPISSGPSVIVKEAALTSAPLRSQIEKEKSSLIPVNVLKKKAPKPQNE